MALFHLATLTPTKVEAIAAWAPTQPWGPAPTDEVTAIGSYRLDDPEGRVGMEVHLVRAGTAVLQIPLTYRDAPLEGADDALVTEMEHSALGTRWVYDGLHDPQLLPMLAAAVLTGQGEALGLAYVEGRWYVSPSEVRIQGGGWASGPVAVDGFALVEDGPDGAHLRNDRFALTLHRWPTAGARPPIGLTATWTDQSEPVVLAEIRDEAG